MMNRIVSLKSKKALVWRTFRCFTMFQILSLVALITLLLGRPLYKSLIQDMMQPVYARKLRVDLKRSLRARHEKTGVLIFDQQTIAQEVLQRWENPMSLYTPEEITAIKAAEEAVAKANAEPTSNKVAEEAVAKANAEATSNQEVEAQQKKKEEQQNKEEEQQNEKEKTTDETTKNKDENIQKNQDAVQEA
eukprot:TRINITY_DN36352_c0_g1_i7.p2 TRINITY_DN36352_c0_g1~~TRINITY_DN36352_c0_g1_i7.p2  ORF type:complete len:191 (-),score=30.91 TRINITY_DN36352_c0_g1_i7:526-1098(-)